MQAFALNKKSVRLISALALLLAVGADSGLAATILTGRGRFEKIKGKPGMGYAELYESNLFLSPSAYPPLGPARRLGTSYESGGACFQVTVHDGRYCIDGMPGGTYSMIVNQPLFFITPKVQPNVTIVNNQTVTVNLDLPIDFSTYFRDQNQWTISDSSWYQTFTATGTAIRGVSFVLAGAAATVCNVSILKDNGNADVRNWQLLGTRSVDGVVANTDLWVRWRSGEIPTVPGVKYAVKVTGQNGGIQPYKRDKDGNSYAGGQAYNGSGVVQNYDLNYVVFADNDGTRVTMCKRNTGIGQLCSGNFATKWGQTFIAAGSGLAGADVWAAGANSRWDLEFTWRIRAGGANGSQIGPTKTTFSAPQAFGSGLHGVSYNPGEVSLTPGQTYFIEFAINNPPPESNGFNPYMMNLPGGCQDQGGGKDDYPDGTSYRWNGTSWDQRGDDVNMTIVEYQTVGPIIVVTPETLARTVNAGQNLPNDTFTIRNAGPGTLTYTVNDNVAWLSVSPDNGTSTGETDSITISYSTAGLAAGSYVGKITVTGNSTNSPQTLTVNLTVNGPRIELNKSSLNRFTYLGGSLSNDTFTVRNSSGGTLNYTVSDNAAWLSVLPTSGSSTGGTDTITVSYSVAGLPVATHQAVISVSDPLASNTPQIINVTVEIRPLPGDFDNDRDVDQADFGHLQQCLSGPGFPQTAPACLNARLDADDDVDQDDVLIFIGCMSGSGVAANPGCAP